jgi:hypothetical protein
VLLLFSVENSDRQPPGCLTPPDDPIRFLAFASVPFVFRLCGSWKPIAEARFPNNREIYRDFFSFRQKSAISAQIP